MISTMQWIQLNSIRHRRFKEDSIVKAIRLDLHWKKWRRTVWKEKVFRKRGRGRDESDPSAQITVEDSENDNISMQVASPRSQRAREREKKMGCERGEGHNKWKIRKQRLLQEVWCVCRPRDICIFLVNVTYVPLSDASTESHSIFVGHIIIRNMHPVTYTNELTIKNHINISNLTAIDGMSR